MENYPLKIFSSGEYLIKELTEKEFREKTHYERDHETLSNVLIETGGDGDLPTPQSVQTKAKTLLKRLNGIRRAFGLYYNDEYFGYISFVGYDSITPEIQIELNELFRNKGIGFRVLSLLINQIFEERSDIEYFRYCVLVDNIASIKLVEKLGGKKIETGHFIEQIISKYHIARPQNVLK